MDIAVVVNLKARRGTNAVATKCRAALPRARVLASRSVDEVADFLQARSPGLLLSGGGDGTAVALLNTLRRSAEPGAATRPFDVALGVLPLGTGNGWARAVGAPPWRAALARLGEADLRRATLPLRRFDLVEVEGVVAHFAGTGWDAELIDDFHAQKTAPGLLPKARREGLGGYLNGLFTRTIPRHLREPQVEVEIVNTGNDALGVDEQGQFVPLVGGEHGRVLYRGPMSVCAAGTSPEWGFGFRAFPFAAKLARRFCLRVYAGRALEATMRMRSLWRGVHPVPKMHTWLLTECRATFSRPVPFQIGGDRHGHRDVVDYRLAEEQVDVLDWRWLTN